MRRRRFADIEESTALYVDAATGSDTNQGTALAPLATIARANALLGSYPLVTTIYVAAGTYSEEVVSAKAGITYVSAANAIIDGADTRRGFTITHANVSITGFEIRNVTDGVRATGAGATGCVANGLTVHAISNIGIYFTTSAHGGSALNCTIYDSEQMAVAWFNADSGLCENCEAYSIAVKALYAYNSPNTVFRDCYVHDTPGSAYGYECEGNSDDVLFVRCWAYNLRHGFISKTSLRTRFEACVAWDISSFAFYCKAGIDTSIWHCVAYACTTGVELSDNSGTPPGSSGANVKNSIFQECTTAINVSDDGSDTGIDADFNDFFGNGFVGNWLGATQITLANWRAASGQDANSYALDPAFVTTVQGGFVLPPGSALENAGTDLGGTDPTPDLGREGSSLP